MSSVLTMLHDSCKGLCEDDINLRQLQCLLSKETVKKVLKDVCDFNLTALMSSLADEVEVVGNPIECRA